MPPNAAGAAGDAADDTDAAPLLPPPFLPLEVERDAGAPTPPTSAAPSNSTSPPPRRAAWCLITAHALSAWVNRAWEFSAGLALLDLAPGGTLAPVAALGLAEAAATFLAGPALGRFVDTTPRARAARTLIALQSVATLTSAGAVLAARALATARPAAAAGAALAAALAAAAAAVGAAGATLSVEREWPPALAAGGGSALALLNARMRQVDLTCLILAPGVAGALMASPAGPAAAVAAVAALSAAVWAPQFALLAAARAAAPSLRDDEDAKAAAAAARAAASSSSSSPRPSASAFTLWRTAPSFPAAAALALLYTTVLSFGPLATAYLATRGLPPPELAAWRGAGALAGLAATAAYPWARARVGLDAAGAAGLAAQWSALAAGVAAAFWIAPASPAGARVLAASLALSRFGLWAFDQAAGQSLQERVPRESLGAVNGVQASLQAAGGALSFAAGLALPNPATFGWLAGGSLACVGAAGAVFGAGTACQRRQGWL